MDRSFIAVAQARDTYDTVSGGAPWMHGWRRRRLVREILHYPDALRFLWGALRRLDEMDNPIGPRSSKRVLGSEALSRGDPA